jgi:hypothetical protein
MSDDVLTVILARLAAIEAEQKVIRAELALLAARNDAAVAHLKRMVRLYGR